MTFFSQKFRNFQIFNSQKSKVCFFWISPCSTKCHFREKIFFQLFFQLFEFIYFPDLLISSVSKKHVKRTSETIDRKLVVHSYAQFQPNVCFLTAINIHWKLHLKPMHIFLYFHLWVKEVHIALREFETVNL